MQPTTYVCGHRNPDTDSIVSAMAYASLCNALGENGYIPARLGHLNDETKFLLNRFGFQPPLYMSTVRTQIKDIDFDRPPRLNANVPVSHAWEIMQENPNLSALPVTNEDETLFGMLTAGGIAESDMRAIEVPVVRDAPVFNVLSALEGHIINREDDVFDSISGEVVIALPTPGDTLKGVSEGAVVICGQQEDVVEKALELKASCIILCQSNLAEKYHGLSSQTCIIATPFDAWRRISRSPRNTSSVPSRSTSVIISSTIS